MRIRRQLVIPNLFTVFPLLPPAFQPAVPVWFVFFTAFSNVPYAEKKKLPSRNRSRVRRATFRTFLITATGRTKVSTSALGKV